MSKVWTKKLRLMRTKSAKRNGQRQRGMPQATAKPRRRRQGLLGARTLRLVRMLRITVTPRAQKQNLEEMQNETAMVCLLLER